VTQPPVGVPTCYRHTDRETYVRCQRCERPICPDCMRDAAVGFQCPECVSEGARSTRQGRTAYGGRRPTNAALTSIVLIGLNAAVWVAILATGWTKSRVVEWLALSPTGTCNSEQEPGSYYPRLHTEALCGRIPDGSWSPGVADGAYWQLLTSAFTHVEIWHIAVNMLSLWILGPQLETILGRTRFVALYLVSGLAGSVTVYWLSDHTTLGASGAIFGLFGALAVVVLKVGGDFRQILMLLAINAFITFAVPNVSWQGHVGGLVGGALVAAILVYAPKPRRTALQATGIGLVVVALAVATVLRSLQLA
jgi:membrane associated rhomboid family serine protease